MQVNHSEFAIVKLLDAATPKLFSEDDRTQLAADMGGGVPGDAVDHSPFTIVKLLDAATPKLFSVDDYTQLAADTRSGVPGDANVLLGDGSVGSTDTSAVATLMDFDFPSSSEYSGSHALYQDIHIPTPDTGDGFWLV